MNNEMKWMFLDEVNVVLGVVLLLYLFHFLSYRKTAERSTITTLAPLLTRPQSHLFIFGGMLWTSYLILAPVQFFIPELLYLILRAALLTATIMYLAHAFMYFGMASVQDGPKPNNFTTITYLRRGGIVGITLLGTAAYFAHESTGLRDFILNELFPLWQLAIVTHTFLWLRTSSHPSHIPIMAFLAIWAAVIPAELFRITIVTTITLLFFLFLLLHVNFLYVKETFKRALSFKNERDVMVSFLTKLSGGAAAAQPETENIPPDIREEEFSFLGGFDVDRLLRLTLDYGLELCDASGGAIFIRDDIQDLLSKNRPKSDVGKLLSARAVSGPYPPGLELGHQPNISQRLEYLHNAIRSEKIQVGRGIVGQVAQTGESILVADGSKDDRIQQQHEESLYIRTMLAVPLKVQNRTAAVLSVVNKKKGGTPFTQEDEAALQAMAEQAAVTLGSAIMHNSLKEKDRLEREIHLAREVQQLLLPKYCPQISGYEIAARSDPAQEVGGDYYDFLRLDEDHLAIVIADVSGKGIPGALTMATVRSALRALSGRHQSARDLLIDLNHFIQPDMRRGTFVSMLLAVLCISTGELELVRAGHEPLLLLKRGAADFNQIKPAGIALGLVDGDLFSHHTEQQILHLSQGDTVVLYTDGITEAMDRYFREFTLDRFLILLKETHTMKAEEMVQAISKRITMFAGGTPQHDDLTLLVIKRNPQPTFSTSPQIPRTAIA